LATRHLGHGQLYLPSCIYLEQVELAPDKNGRASSHRERLHKGRQIYQIVALHAEKHCELTDIPFISCLLLCFIVPFDQQPSSFPIIRRGGGGNTSTDPAFVDLVSAGFGVFSVVGGSHGIGYPLLPEQRSLGSCGCGVFSLLK